MSLVCRVLTALILLSSLCAAQSKESTDLSKEPYVLERSFTHVSVAEDGSAVQHEENTFRVTSQAGIQPLGILRIPYAKAYATVDVEYIRVRKPDGKVIETSLDSVDDMPSEITRQAPEYSDLREKHFPVKALAVGDLLETSYSVRTKPMIPGQFWIEFNLNRNTIIKSVVLEVEAPVTKPLKFRSPSIQPKITEKDGKKILSWAYDVPKVEKIAEEPIPAAPDILISTFQSWDELGKWWIPLAADSTVVAPEIATKARVLTADAKTQEEKAKILINYVSSHIRYIGVSFGIGRYQPHPALDVFQNGYGDCKDKYALLSAMLRSQGITSYPVLVNAERNIDPDVPSPAQFDHVLNVAVVDGKEVWLDATQEVAPYGYLEFQIRNRRALVMRDKGATLELAPPGRVLPNEWHFTSQGELSSEGTYKGHMLSVMTGTQAVILRAAFRAVGQSKWQELAQAMSYRQNFAGTVSNVDVTGVDDPEAALQVSYDYLRMNYSDWENRRITPPFPPTGLAVREDQRDPTDPLPSQMFLGEPLHVVYKATVKLPSDASSVPSNAEVSTDFAAYSSRVSVKDRVLNAERTVDIKMPMLPISRRPEFIKFGRGVYDSEVQDVRLAMEGAKSEQATTDGQYKLYEDARSAGMNRRFDVAESKARELIRQNPKFPGVHQILASIFLSQNNIDGAIVEFKKEVEANPTNPESYRFYSAVLSSLQKNKELRELMAQCTSNIPTNTDCWVALARADSMAGNYKLAASEAKKAMDLDPSASDSQYLYANLLISSGEKQSGLDLLTKISETRTDPDTWNTVAYQMADANFKLDKAEELALAALKQVESEAAKTSLNEVTNDDLRRISKLTAFWDTVGWVYFKQGKLDLAEQYLLASWRLYPRDLIGAHLGQIYDKEGKHQKAIETYSLASSLYERSGTSAPHFSADLLRKASASAKTNSMASTQAIQDLRTGKASFMTPRPANGEFYFLFGAKGKLEDIKYISGGKDIDTPAMRSKILSVIFPTIVPPGNPDVKIIRRGTVFCPGKGSMCSAVLFAVEDVAFVTR